MYLTNGTLNYNLTKEYILTPEQIAERNAMIPDYPDPNDERFKETLPVFTILDNLLCRDGVSIGKVYNNKTGKVVEITETTETGFKYRDTEEDALINKDNSIAVVEKLTGLKGEVVNKPNNIITYEASAKLAETTSDKSAGLHTNAFSGANGQLTVTNHTFENGVGTIEFEEDVTTILGFAFYQTSITKLVMPNSVTMLEGHTTNYQVAGPFTECSSLREIVLSNNLTDIGSYCFSNCSSLTSITIPNSVISIGDGVFSNCESLTSVTIPSGVTSIGTDAFSDCTSLTSVTIGSGVTSIGVYAFGGCTSLTSVTIPNGITSIEGWAFQGCSGLTSITSLATTAPTISKDTFEDVKRNGTLYVPQGSTGYDTWMGTDNYYLGLYNWTKVEQ